MNPEKDCLVMIYIPLLLESVGIHLFCLQCRQCWVSDITLCRALCLPTTAGGLDSIPSLSHLMVVFLGNALSVGKGLHC